MRQKIRKALILVSFILFPITMFYLSPALIIMGASHGIIVGSFISFTSMFIISLFLGRLFCGWVCPGAGLQEICFTINNKPVKRGDYLKYIIWFPWITSIIILFIKSKGFHSIQVLYQIPYGISMGEVRNFFTFYFFITLIVVLSLVVGKRSFCHHVCWMAPFMVFGRKIRNVFKLPALQLECETDKCKHCHTCKNNCPMSIDVEDMVLKNQMEKAECILCGTCIDNCKEKVIRYKWN